MEDEKIEEIYVQNVYEKLAQQQVFNEFNLLKNQNDSRNLHRLWPNVRNFVTNLPVGSVLIDAGNVL